MKNNRSMDKNRASTLLPAAMAVSLTVSMVLFPEEAFAAAVMGLDIWWNIVFPALLPFFIGSELLMGMGVVHFMGVLMQPLMRPVFNVPGVGSFVMAMGLASGFPIGSILTARLRREKLCSKAEGERLMSFTNTADPLFMFGAVAVGMFAIPRIGAAIVLAHYLSSILTGMLLRFYGRNQPDTAETRISGSILRRAFDAMHTARRSDGRAFGSLMGDAVRSSVNTLLLIGGFIILFSVIIRILTVIGAVSVLSAIIVRVLSPLGLDPGLTPALISGFFEVTLGCRLAAQAGLDIPLIQKVMAAGAIIAWSGLSVHAQVASIISDTDMKITPFVCARFIHALLAAGFTWLLLGPLAFATNAAVPVFAGLQTEYGLTFVQRLGYMSWAFIILCAVLLGVGIIISVSKSCKIIIFRR